MPSPRPKLQKRKELDENHPLNFKFNPGPMLQKGSAQKGKMNVRYRHGVLGTLFANGTRKVKADDLVYMFYQNGDIAICFPDGAKGYRYAETKTVELEIPGGPKLLAFADGHIERHLPNGEKEVRFSDGRFKKLLPSGEWEKPQTPDHP
jgi:hypothetical protein